MLVLPVLAQPVRVIGGPIGSPVGPTGPTGAQQDLLIDGAAGALGPAGMLGLTGWAGAYGAAAALIGPTGAYGPYGSMGYSGPPGCTGFGGVVPPERFRYFENRSGVVGIPFGSSGLVGCNFTYQPTFSGLMFVAFSGLVKPDAYAISVGMSGISGPAVTIAAPGDSIPFFLSTVSPYNQPTDSDGNPLPWPTLTFDLSASPQHVPVFDFTAHGSVININCVIMEF